MIIKLDDDFLECEFCFSVDFVELEKGIKIYLCKDCRDKKLPYRLTDEQQIVISKKKSRGLYKR